MPKVSMRMAVLAMTGLILAALVSAAGQVRADTASADEATAEKVIGDEDAPVTILAFESLSCPHCATFHREAWPKIKEQYVDTGKAKYVYRDFPTNEAGAIAAMAARCVPPDRYFGMIEMLYNTQNSWLRSANPRESLKQTARLGGLTAEEFETCVTDQNLFQFIRNRQEAASSEYGVNSTPTFIIGDQRIVGAESFEVFEEAIEAELSGETANPSSALPIIALVVAAAVALGGFFWWRRRSARS